MAPANSRDAVMEIYELADKSSSNSSQPPPTYPSQQPPSQCGIISSFRLSKKMRTTNFLVAAIAICLLALSFNMILFAGHSIHEVRNSPRLSDVGDDPEWPKKIDSSFQIWIICIGGFTFIHAAITLTAVLFTPFKKYPDQLAICHIICYVVLHFMYYTMFKFDDITGENPVTQPNGRLEILRFQGEMRRKYPTIISWTCMKNSSQGGSSIDYHSICHTAITAKYLAVSMPVVYMAAVFALAFCLVVRYARQWDY